MTCLRTTVLKCFCDFQRSFSCVQFPKNFGTSCPFCILSWCSHRRDVNCSPSSPTRCSSLVHSPGTSPHQLPDGPCCPTSLPCSAFFSFFSIYLFLAAGSSLPFSSFLVMARSYSLLWCTGRASHCGGFSSCREQAVGKSEAAAVVGCGPGRFGPWALEHRVNSCGARACGIFPD